MKILSAKQIREADEYSIANEPISSLDLMERAASGLWAKITDIFSQDVPFLIFCGKGNNGGDGLALARLLSEGGYKVQAVVVEHSDKASDDFQVNLERLKDMEASIGHLSSADQLKTPMAKAVVVDAMLGSGLSRPLEGLVAEVVKRLNDWENPKVAIDIPTGLFADDNSENELDRVLKADYTFSLQMPKLSMMHRDTAPLAGKVELVDIGLHPEFIEKAQTHFYFLQKKDIQKIFKPRKKFSYKGTYGHALLVAGSEGSMGAAMMSASAALRSGAGLLTVHVPECGLLPMQSYLPEAMVKKDHHHKRITRLPDLKKITAIGAGPGMGTHEETARVVKHLIQESGVPMVFDADALNILSENKTWLAFLHSQVVLTPHPGEFKRLLDSDQLGPDYLEKLKEFSKKNKVVTVLKDSITAVADSRGDLYFLDEGSPALASPGSGDVLTGIILGLLSSGYTPLQAALLGVYLQGRAGNLAGEKYSLEAALAGDVVKCLGEAFRELYGKPEFDF